MKLRTKVIALIVCLFAVLAVAQLVVQRGILLPSFADLERESATTDMERVSSVLDGYIEQLAITARDWGNWIDTYTFMSGGNPGYVAVNLSTEAITALRLDALAFIDLDGNVRWPTATDKGPAGTDLIPNPALPDSREWRKALREGRAISGLLRTERGPMLAAMHPVLDGTGAGAHRGAVLMGRLLTPERIARFGRQARVPLIMSTGKAALVTSSEAARAIEVGRHTRLVERKDTTVVFKGFYDPGGAPLFTLRIEVPRKISARGRKTVEYASLFLIFSGAAALALLIAVLNRSVLSPVTQLTRHARKVGTTGDLTSTLDLKHPDELGELSREFDSMVRHLADAKAQAEIQAQRAQAASKAKTDFLAMMSHEIRTPMSGVLGCVSLMLDTPLRADQRELAHTIRSSADSLLTILNDILDYSKIEAGRLTIEETIFDLRACCDDVHRLLQQPAAQRGLDLRLDYSPQVPQYITGDPVRVRQVLLNLASNAIKFTEHGSVTIEVLRAGVSHVRVNVVDTGIGISAEHLPKLFQHFTQADSSITRRYGGTGLGLAICKRLVELMGGEIGATSTAGHGSTFHFVVPLLAAAPGSETRAEPASHGAPASLSRLHSPQVALPPAHLPQARSLQAALSLLVVEDNPINQRVAQHMLVKLGHTVEVAQNGREALERLREHHYDLVFMDCQMPEMDGFEATAHIRDCASKVLDHAVPVIAMTANAFAEDRGRCLAAGMNDFLAKPVDRKALAEMLERWAAAVPAAVRAGSSAAR